MEQDTLLSDRTWRLWAGVDAEAHARFLAWLEAVIYLESGAAHGKNKAAVLQFLVETGLSFEVTERWLKPAHFRNLRPGVWACAGCRAPGYRDLCPECRRRQREAETTARRAQEEVARQAEWAEIVAERAWRVSPEGKAARREEWAADRPRLQELRDEYRRRQGER